MIQKIRGIVLHTVKYSDANYIVDLFTDVLGRSSFLLPISKNKKSSVKSILFQPLSMVEFEVDVRNNGRLQKIREARSFNPFVSIPYHPYKSAIALFLAEFLHRTVRVESENGPLFAFLHHSILWLDATDGNYANFHLVFLMRLTRFLGIYPNVEDYHTGDRFDLLNASYISSPIFSSGYQLSSSQTLHVSTLLRLNYETMKLFRMNRTERMECLEQILKYYQLHIPDFPEMKSLDVLRELFNA